jgi:DNA-binding NarL/FixJ family response regulator
VLDLHVATVPAGDEPSGSDLVSGLREIEWQVLIVTGTRDEPRMAAAIAAGAVGALPKTSSFDTLVNAVLKAVQGIPLLDESERQRWLALHDHYQAEKHELVERLAELSPREREVLDLLTQGYRAITIAETFGISLSELRGEIRSMLAKLAVGSQLEAVTLAAKAVEMHLTD